MRIDKAIEKDAENDAVNNEVYSKYCNVNLELFVNNNDIFEK